MFKKIMGCLFIILLAAPSVFAETDKVEIYDISQNKVVKTLPIAPSIHEEGISFLKGINGVSKKFRPIPNTGYLIKMPVNPAEVVENEWMNDLVDEMIIIISEKDEPILMVYDNENKPHFFVFKGNLDRLSKTLRISLSLPSEAGK